MKLRWRIALGTAAAVVLAAAVIAAVPSSRAAAGGFFADVFNIKTGPAATLNYLPSGFTSQASAAVGSLSVGPENKADAMEEALYRDGDEFVAVTTRSDDGAALPNGQDATVNGVKAVLQTGLSGSFDLAVLGPDGAKDGGTPPAGASPQGGAPSGGDGPVTIQGAGSVTVVSGDTVITGEVPAGQSEIGISVNSNGEGQSVVNVAGDPVDLPGVSYEGANSLTWIVDGTRIVLLSNLPVEELQKIADGLVLND